MGATNEVFTRQQLTRSAITPCTYMWRERGCADAVATAVDGGLRVCLGKGCAAVAVADWSAVDGGSFMEVWSAK